MSAYTEDRKHVEITVNVIIKRICTTRRMKETKINFVENFNRLKKKKTNHVR